MDVDVGMSRKYVMKQSVKARLERKNGEALACRRCGELLCVGDSVVSRSNQHRYVVTVVYHEKCFEELWI